MKILVTGAKGFVGKNLVAELHNRKESGYCNIEDVFEFDINTDATLLDNYAKEVDFVFHLAGVNRPKDEKEFMEGNYGFTTTLLNALKKYGNKAPVLITSSTQASLDNPYGRSKKEAENIIFNYCKETGTREIVYRLPNVFGKWCKPNYNSAIATFCNNIATGLPIKINDPSVIMSLVYIDDVVEEFIQALTGNENKIGEFCSIPTVHTVTLGKIAELIEGFKRSREDLTVPNMSNEFEKKLYSTYLSYLPKDEFSYPLNMHIDNRGSFTEFIRTPDRGQVSVNISYPGITKGNHWHHTKNEKFLVVKGKGLIQFRKIGTDEIIDYHVSGDKLEAVDIPTGYTHNIINEGEEDMVTIMWVNEAFDSEHPDTYYLKV